MALNNAPIVIHLAEDLEDREESPSTRVRPRERPRSDPCLPSRLPTAGFLQREADRLAPQSVAAEKERILKSLEDAANSADDDNQHTPTTPTQSHGEESPSSRRKSFLERLPSALHAARILRGPTGGGGWKPPEPFEIMRAIERKDITYLMEVRDRSLKSLLQKTGDVTPIIHAMRIEHTDVAILLVGAFSRYINQLTDEDMTKPETKQTLRQIRVNLKFAIDYGLQKSQKDLIASFLQTLVMSEGDSWVALQTADIAIALRQGTEGKPVRKAEDAVRSFATKALGKADMIASLEDYVANATADLVMMAAWSCVLQAIPGDPIPPWYFARDDRVYRAFVERLDQRKDIIQRKTGRRLRWQLRELRNHLEGRNTSHRSKVQILARELDEGEGV